MRPRKLLRIARWEVTKNAGGIDRKTAVIVGVTLLLFGAVAPLVVAQGGVAIDQGIYRVGIDEESPLYPVVEDDPTFAIRDPGAELGAEIDVRVSFTQAVSSGTTKGEAALSELRSSVTAYNDRLMRGESNQSAAFPVSVTLNYVERTVQISPGGNGDGGTSDGTGDGDGDGGTGGGTGDGGTGGGSGTDDGSGTGDGRTGGGLGGGFPGFTGSSGATGAPSDIAPPFPFESLVLAFLFVLPLNFVIQAYGSTMLSERINRRGELMLVSPVTRGDIIGGKTLPYFAGAMLFEGLIVLGVVTLLGAEGGVFSILAVVPLVLLFLSATFLGAMFARSFKELTFVTVAITVSLTTYAFVPAIFTEVTPIALISPLTIVVRDIQGASISLTAFGFSTLPPLLAATVFYGLGAGLYREEDMFTQRAIPLKILDAFAGRVKRKRSVVLVSVIVIPFVFLAEMIGVAMLFAVPEAVSIPAILLIVVVIEEVAKSLHVYAGYAHNRWDDTLATAAIVGSLSGLGFFLGEKFFLLVQLLPADLPEIEQAALASGGAVPDVSPLLVGALLLAPLLLHVVTASASAIGMREGRRGYVLGFTVAVAIHFVYNYTVVMLFV